MSSDVIRSADNASSAAGDDRPSSSSFDGGGSGSGGGGGGGKVKLLCSYGGKILPRPSDGLLRYVGGNTRIVTVRRDCTMPEILRKLAEAYGGPAVFRYQLPGEELDALISVSGAEDLAHMMEEYDKLIAENPSAKLRLFLYSPSELASLDFEHEFHSRNQDLSSRYLEAINGVDACLRRKDSITSFSTQSDGTACGELGMDCGGSIESTLPAIPSPTDNVPNNQLSSNFTSQPVPNSPDTGNSGNLIEGLNAFHTELLQAAVNVPQAYMEPHHPQFMNPQPFVVVGVPTQISAVPLQPTQYVPATHVHVSPVSVPPASQSSNGKLIQTRAGMNAEESSNVVKILKPPSDPKLLPLSQFPPLPPPHLLAPSGERNESRQAPPSSKGQMIRLEDCSLCQKGLRHVHSDTLIHEQTNGPPSIIPETKLALQSHHSEDIARMQVPKMVVTGALAGNVVEPHIANVVNSSAPQIVNVVGSAPTQTGNVHGPAPLGTYGLDEIIPEVARDNERPVAYVAENLGRSKATGQQSSVGSQESSQSCGTIANPQRTIQEEVMPKKPALPQVLLPTMENHGPAKALLQPTPLMLSNNPSKVVSPQHHPEGTLQEQMKFLQTKAVENLDHSKTSGQPISVGLPIHVQSSLGTATNPETMHKKPVIMVQSLNTNGDNDHANVYVQPTAFDLPSNPSIVSTGPPQYYQQYPQTKIPVKQDTKPLVADGIPIQNLNVQAEGQMIHENMPVCLPNNSRPVEGVKEVLHVNPPETSSFSDYTKPVSAPTKESKIEIFPLIPDNGFTVKRQNASTAMPVDSLPSSSGVVLDINTGQILDPVLSGPQTFAYIPNPQPAKTSHITYVTGSDIPSVYYPEAGSAVMEMPSSVYSDTMSGKPPGECEHDTLKFSPKEVTSDVNVAPSASSQINANSHAINMEHVQVTSDSLFFNDDSEKILVSAAMLQSRSTGLASKDSVAMKNMHPDSYSFNSKGSDMAMLSEGVSWIPAGSQSKDIHADLTQPLTEHEEQDMQAPVEGKVAQFVKPSKSPVPDFISHEPIDVNPHHANNGSKESAAVKGDQKMEAMKNSKQTEKPNNGFPNVDNLGHLQVIKNNDLEELQELGSGTFGTVYHGKWRGTDVAIKRLNDRVFNGKQSDQEKARADFWNEACKLASLHHPNVVAFYGIVLDGPGGSIATVTEFMVNGSLRTVLQKNEKTLDRHKQLLIASDVAFGMEYLHSKNIIHFDLKSDNLLVNLRDPQRPVCKVGDLGLSKLKYETLMSGGMRGTLPWMAPELLGGSVKHTEKVDVFSFGIVMWELLTSKEPYADLHYGVIIGGIINNRLRPEVPESCDPDWRILMEECWSNEPTERPSFTEIANRLRAMSSSPQKG